MDIKLRKKLIKIIDQESRGVLNDYCKCRIADAILDSNLFCSSETLEEQMPHIYRWAAVEDDGYTHSEAGVANNMLDAFIKATEYSPSYHKRVVIDKIPDEELTKEERELKEFLAHA